jgi:tRNA pseudouridine38-40 synthase
MKLVVAYLGGSFHGWQRQQGQRTVQATLEDALQNLCHGQRVKIEGAGRTDAGVHAKGQVAHTDLPVAIPSEGLARALNNKLPPEVRVRSVRPVGSGFHARKSARGKLYTYRARWRRGTLPWHGLRTAIVTRVVDLASLSAAARLLPGTHDWGSFTVPNPETSTTIRSLYRVQMHPRVNGLDLDFVGDGFLRYQVRRLVGALIEVGRGRRSVDDLESLIKSPEPGASVWTAPAEGLTLERVYYRRSRHLEFD